MRPNAGELPLDVDISVPPSPPPFVQLVELLPPPPPPMLEPPIIQVHTWEPLPHHMYGCIDCIGKKPLSDLLEAQSCSIALLCGRLDTMLGMGNTVVTRPGDYESLEGSVTLANGVQAPAAESLEGSVTLGNGVQAPRTGQGVPCSS